MGLFSNNKKPCPICGNATPRLLPTKVEGVPICKECDKKIDLPNGVLDSMTLDDFRRHPDFSGDHHPEQSLFAYTPSKFPLPKYETARRAEISHGIRQK